MIGFCKHRRYGAVFTPFFWKLWRWMVNSSNHRAIAQVRKWRVAREKAEVGLGPRIYTFESHEISTLFHFPYNSFVHSFMHAFIHPNALKICCVLRIILVADTQVWESSCPQAPHGHMGGERRGPDHYNAVWQMPQVEHKGQGPHAPLSLIPTSCVTLSNSLHFSDPQWPHLWNGCNNSTLLHCCYKMRSSK